MSPLPLRNTISGSSSATVLGLNNYQTPFHWWQNTLEKAEPGFNASRGYELPEPFEGNSSTRFGHAFESSNIELVEEKLGCKIIDQERVFKGVINGVPVSSHVDGLIKDGDKTILFEGKTTIDRAYNKKWNKETNTIPREYMLQLQHNIMTAGLNGVHIDEAIISVLVFPFVPEKLEEGGWQFTKELEAGFPIVIKGDDGKMTGQWYNTMFMAQSLEYMGYHHIFRIKRDDELIASMLKHYSTFWNDYIIPRVPPEPMNIDDIKRMYPTQRGTIIIDDQQTIDWMQEYKEIGKEIGTGGNLKKRQTQLKELILKKVSEMPKTEDEESANGLVFRDSRGNKLGSLLKSVKTEKWSYRG